MLRTSLLLFALGLSVTAQQPASAPSNPNWTKPFPPFRIIGNIYWVGRFPDISQAYARSFRAQKDLKIDVWLASHAGQFRLHDKYKPGDPYNPDRFVDPAGYLAAVERQEKAYLEQLAREQKR